MSIFGFRYVVRPGCCYSEEGCQQLQLQQLTPGPPCLQRIAEKFFHPIPLPLLLLRLLLLPLGPSVGEFVLMSAQRKLRDSTLALYLIHPE